MNNETQSSRYGLRTKVASVFLSAALLATTFTGLGGALTSSTEVNAANDYGLADHVYDGVIVHAWNWSFTEIKNHMKDFADAGYTSVQTSPVQRPKDYSNTKTTQWDWWKVYQPTTLSFSPDGHPWFGTKDEFKAMCDEADKYGIKIIVDVVSNHLANDTGGKGNTRADISSQNDPTYRDDDSCWHLNGSTGIDYGSPKRDGSTTSLTWGFGGWPDLNTGSKKVQNGVIDLLKECIDLGADGFRFDAAKHIEVPTDPGGASDFWPTVINGANDYAKAKGVEIYCYGEILDDAATDIKNYTQYIGVTDNRAGNNIRYGIRNGNIGAAASSSLYYNGVSYDKIVLWAESHDTYANDDYTGDSTRDNQDQVNRTWAIVAARQYPALYYIRPTNPKTQLMGEASTNTSYKNTEVAEVNKFHNYFTGQSEYMSSSGNNVLVERGTSGVVITNIYGNAENISAKVNKMADGTYKDQVSGNTFTVSGGTISGQLGSKGIAVVYNAEPIVKGSVSATPATDTSFDDTLTVTLKASDVTNAKYTTSEGASGTYTDGQTITVGASTAVGGSVTVTLSGTKSDGTAATATYTYNKKDPDAKVVVYFDNSSYNWSSVYAYVYDESSGTARELAAWPGTKMSVGSSGFYELEIPDAYTANGQVIFAESSSSSNRYPADQLPGLKIGGSSKKFSSGNTWENYTPVVKKLSVSLSTSVSSVTVGTPITLTATAANTSGTVNYTFTQGSTTIQASSTKSTASWTPSAAGTYTITVTAKDSSGTATASKTVTVAEPKDPLVTVDKASGASFTTETTDITLSLSNATSGTYSVDGGPVKKFTGTQTVTIGEGKIGDSTVTVETTATNGTTTKTYKFTYDKKYVVKTTSASAASSCDKYETNPGGNVGANKTIKSASDFTSDMLIAQGIANDDPATFRGPHEAPKFDLYALYAAWDNDNVYIGIQYTNVTDVVASDQEAPQGGRGKPNGADADIPQMILFDTKTGDYTDGTTNSTKQPTVWNTNITFGGDTKVDKILMYSPKEGINNYSVFPVTNGIIDYDNAVSPGYQMPLEGASVTWEDGFFCDSMYGINGNGYTGYKPLDIESGSAAFIDFLSTNHSTAQDTFCIITLPLKYLGVSANDIQNNGIGIMAVATYGESGIGCLPHDTVMLDNATEPYVKDDSTSGEKSDADEITVALADVGKSGPVPTKPLQVNFGTDKSAPQYTSTALTLKAIGYGGTAPYKYEFSVDGTVVKASNTTDTYTWKPGTEGKHTIKCVITDSTGKTATVSKTFTAETDGNDELINKSTISATKITLGDSVTLKGAASGGSGGYTYAVYYKQTSQTSWTAVQGYASTITKSVTPKAATTYTVRVKAKDSNGNIANKDFKVTVEKQVTELVNNSTISATKINLGSSVTLKGAASGGTGDYTYAVFYKKTSSDTWTTVQGYASTITKTVTPLAATTYTVRVKAKDSAGTVKNKDFTVTVSKALVNNSTISATSITLGQSLTLKGAATGGTSPYTYAVYYRQSSQTTWTTVQSTYASTITKTVTPKAATTYVVRVKAKDAAGTIVNKDFTVKVTKAPLVNNSTISATSIALGQSLTLKGVATGGTSPYTYAVYYRQSSQTTWTAVQSTYASTITKTVTPKAATTYVVRVKAKDAAGTIVNKDFTVKVAKALTNTSKLSATTITLGNTVTVTASATGGTGYYNYAVFYRKVGTSSWTTVQSYQANASITVKPQTASDYEICVKVRDSDNTEAKNYYTVTVKAAALANTSTISATSIVLGDSLTLKGAATGGTSPYTYAVYYRQSSQTTWTAVQSTYASTITKTVTPKAATTYVVRVKAKDAAGTIVNKDFTVTVGKALSVTATASSTSVSSGSSVVIKGAASGGTGGYTYEITYLKFGGSTWTTAKAYGTAASKSIIFPSAGTYSVKVNAKDSSGKVATAYVAVEVS